MAQTIENSNEVEKADSTAAKIARFMAGSVFGIAFIVICFLMLTTALKGPDKVTMEGVSFNAGLVQKAGQKPLDRRLRIGDYAPDFVLSQLGGGPVQLSRFSQQGKVVFVNFWASWCQPCRDEMKDINDFYLAHKNDNVQVLEVNYREDDAAVKAYFKDNNLTMPVVMDGKGEVAGGYKATAFPESYFIDKKGVIRELKNEVGGQTQSSSLTRAEMEQKLQATLEASK